MHSVTPRTIEYPEITLALPSPEEAITKKFQGMDAKRRAAIIKALEGTFERDVDPFNVIQNYEFNPITLKGQQSLITLALAYARKWDSKISDIIESFGIDKTQPAGHAALVEIAKQQADKYKSNLSQHIQSYGIEASSPKGLTLLLEIAALAAKKDLNFSQYFKNYGFNPSDPQVKAKILEMAKTAVLNGESHISKYIKNFGLDPADPSDQRELLKIAKTAAIHDKDFSEFVKNYGIDSSTAEGKKALIEFAYKAVRNGNHFSKFVKNYEIDPSTPEGQDTLIELAILAAKTHTDDGVSQYLENYSIDSSTPKGRRALIEIAKQTAQQYESNIAQYIHNYGIDNSTEEGRQALFEIAIRSMQKYQTRTPAFVQNFGIDKSTPEGQMKLIHLAKIGACQEGDVVSPHMQNFGIDPRSKEGHRALLQIALASIRHKHNTSISKYIQNYGFDSHTPEGYKALSEIAMLAALKNGENTSQYIQNFGFDPQSMQGKSALMRIAKIAAQSDGQGTSQYIQNYGFDPLTPEGQKFLYEIADMAIQQNPEGASGYIHHYGLKTKSPEGQNALRRLALKAARLSKNDGIAAHIQNYAIDPTQPEGQKVLIKILHLCLNRHLGILVKNLPMFHIDSSQPQGKEVLMQAARAVIKWNMGFFRENLAHFGIDKDSLEGQSILQELARQTQVDVRLFTLPVQKNETDPYYQTHRDFVLQLAKNTANENSESPSNPVGHEAIESTSPPKEFSVLAGAAKTSEVQLKSDVFPVLEKEATLTAQEEKSKTPFEKAIQALEQNPNFFKDLPLYGLHDQNDLLKLAKMAAKRRPYDFAKYIPNFGLDTLTSAVRQEMIEIARTLAVSHPWGVAEHIQNFSIDPATEPGQEVLLDIANTIASRSLESLIRHIEKFKLDGSRPKGKQKLLKWAKMAAEQQCTDLLAQLHCFCLDQSDKEALVEIALVSSRSKVWDSIRCCEAYGIDKKTREGQQALIQIAKIAAEKQPYDFPPKVKNYGIDPSTAEGQSGLIEVAKILAKSNYGDRLFANLEDFGIDSNTPQGQRALIDIALIAVGAHDSEFGRYINNYKIDPNTPEGKAAWQEIARRFALKRSSDFSEHLLKFPIDFFSEEGQRELIEISKSLLNLEGYPTLNLQLGLDVNTEIGKQGLCEIIRLAMLKTPSCAALALPLFDWDAAIDGKAFLLECALAAAGVDGCSVSKHIHNFCFDNYTKEGLKALIDVAKLAMKNNKKAQHYIENYGLDNTDPEGQEALSEIALIAAETHGVTETIELFGIDPRNKRVLAEIALKSAKKDPEELSKHIQLYGFDPGNEADRSVLIEVAKVAMENGGISQYIQNYGIDASTQAGQKALLEIAELAAKNHPFDLSKHVKNYGIDTSTPEGRQAIIHLARIALNWRYIGICEYVQNYELNTLDVEGWAVLAELAKANADRYEGAYIHQWIHLFGFQQHGAEGQKILIEVATIASQKLESWRVAENIERFAIDKTTPQGQVGLVQIAKHIAKQYGEKISRLIPYFGLDTASIEGQAELIEIAKLAAAQDGEYTSEMISNYKIDLYSEQGQAGLAAIAKIAAQQNGTALARHIQKYGIQGHHPKGQHALIDIAKIAAQQPDGMISQYIHYFGIDSRNQQGQQALIEIAKMAARHNGSDVTTHISNYGICKNTVEGQQGLFEIAQLAVEFGPSNYSNIFKYGIDFSTTVGKKYALDLYNRAAMTILMKSSWNKGSIDSRSDVIKNKSMHLPFALCYILTNGQPFLELSKNKKDDATYIDQSLALCQTRFNFAPSELQWIRTKQAKYKDTPSYQMNLIQWFTTTASVCCARQDLEVLFKEQKILWLISKLSPLLRDAITKQYIYISFAQREPVWRKFRTLSENMQHVELACLLFALFPQDQPEIYSQAIECLKKEREFKEASHQKLLLETLLKIKDCDLPPNQISAVVRMLFGLPLKRRVLAFRQVQDLLNFKGHIFLENISSSEEISQALESLFRQRMGLEVDQFAEKYDATLARWRQPASIMTYAAKLQELPLYEKNKALEFFKELLIGVLDNTYTQCRYATKKNPHLAEIASKHPQVFAKWQQPIALEATAVKSQLNYKDEEPLSYKIVKNLKEALAHHHLGGEQQPELFPDLTEYIHGRLESKAAYSQVEKKLIPLSRRLEADEMAVKNRLLIEKKVLEVMSLPDNLEKKLIDLKSQLPKECEFFNDIEGALRSLKKTAEHSENLMTVVDTDHPNHLLLMGSEVDGSCQRVDGSPHLNKCLLGFLLDGKHRLGVVCDSQGKITARSVFRLLLDSTGQPVLFQERVYRQGHSNSYDLLLRQLAEKKAAQLGVPLVFSQNEKLSSEVTVAYPHSVHAKEKNIPFEYVDAYRMGIQREAYTISSVVQLKPKE